MFPEPGWGILTAMITARAHLLFHGLIELQERDDFLNGTWKATVLKAIHTCVWAAVKLQWIKTFTEPSRAEADNEDFTKKKNGLTCKGHSAFHRGLPSLQHWWAPFWKQPLKPKRCTKLARAAACSHPPEITAATGRHYWPLAVTLYGLCCLLTLTTMYSISCLLY